MFSNKHVLMGEFWILMMLKSSTLADLELSPLLSNAGGRVQYLMKPSLGASQPPHQGCRTGGASC